VATENRILFSIQIHMNRRQLSGLAPYVSARRSSRGRDDSPTKHDSRCCWTKALSGRRWLNRGGLGDHESRESVADSLVVLADDAGQGSMLEARPARALPRGL